MTQAGSKNKTVVIEINTFLGSYPKEEIFKVWSTDPWDP